MFIAVSHCLVQCLWFLVYHHHWMLTETPMEYPVATLSYGSPAVIIPQNQSFHVFNHIIDWVDIRVGQINALGVCLGDT